MSTPSWFNENENRAYPFLVGTVNQPASGPLTLANLADDVVVDAGFVVGPRSGFNAGAHTVYLNSIQRKGDLFFLEFLSSDPALHGTSLVFTRHVSDGDYALEFTDSGEQGLSAVSVSGSHSTSKILCDEPLWSGFLVSGTMAALELLLPGDGTVTNAGGAAVVEPGLVQNLANAYVTQLALANDDRTRVTAPAGCPEVVFPYQTGGLFVNDRCLLGDLVFVPGYNAVISQDVANNVITLGAAVGAGAGQPCGEVRLFPAEQPPAGSGLLEGGPRCNEVLRSFNGVGGPHFNFLAGQGVSVTPYPELNKVVVDVNLNGLAMQVSTVSQSC